MSELKKFAFLPALAVFISACNNYKPLPTVPAVDLDRYAGKWYEIASFPQSFQKGCTCTTAEYKPTDEGYIEVLNSCRLDSINGKLKTAKGKAFVDPGTGNAKLKVQFFWPFRGKYWIIDLADDYSYAVVGHPDRDYLWILCRSPHMDSAVYNGIISRITANGFDIGKLNKTIQP